MDWDQYFMSQAYLASMKSKDRSTKVGAIIVGPDNEIRSTGYNSPVRGIDDNREDIHERPKKYAFFEHAERNAIYNAARMGVSIKGCKIYSPWCPCSDCARGIIQSGLTEIILHAEHPKNNVDSRWSESINYAKEMMADCGVSLRFWSGSIVTPVMFNSGIAHDL
jgi:dCMP deaminase